MSYSHNLDHDVKTGVLDQPRSFVSNTTSSFALKTEDSISPALLAAEQHAGRKRVVRTTCLITSLIFICLIAMNIVLLSFICVFHQCQISRRSIISTAPLGLVLTISQITSHIGPVAVPIIMGLFSYLVAARWLRSSLDGGPNRPSPMQLGLLMSMCNGGSLSSLFKSVKYIFKGPSKEEKTAQPPPILRQSVFILASLLAVTYLAAAADSWLHASSTSVIITSHSPFNSLVISNFGREINATMCQLASRDNTTVTGQLSTSTCGMVNLGSGGSGMMLGEGLRVVSNGSDLHRVEYLDDQTAILVPYTLPTNITYSAKTLGVKSQCMTITKECIQPTTSGGETDYGSDAELNLNCSMAGIKYVNGTEKMPLCALDDQGICTTGWQIDSNPFTAGEVVTSMAYLGPDQEVDAFIGNTGWFIHGNKGAWNVVFCNVTALDVTYTYTSSRYILESSTPKPLPEARYMMAGGLEASTGTPVVSTPIDGAGLQTDATYEQAYSLQLSRQMVARGAFIYQPTDAIQIQSENTISGSNLQVIPLTIFVISMLGFACQVLYIALRTLVATSDVQYVGLAALHLKDPLATMQRLYGSSDPVLTWETDLMKKFGDEAEGDRLRVGPVMHSVNGEKGSVFMVTKD
ncbi:hypothetical protein GALMADRAFT_147995 [Galerina marginata CBS 339.88]|uniref:Uncharacterized protein n=1 Tax=Galerina marginata (strain CBS 339.88) TaxID=685588 RepID=A0A067SI25_GALM3|nr:hypothetical protein GALMADRAFT_147995 [Galerina marginata CBS 339.88]